MKKIGVILFIQSKASIKPCMDLLKIIQEIADNYCVLLVYNNNLEIPNINSSQVFTHKIVYKYNSNLLSMPLNYMKSQLKISYYLLNCYSNIDTWTFFMGETSIVPILLLKLIRKKSVLCMSGSLETDLKFRQPSLSRFILLCGKLGLRFSDYIIVYSQSLVAKWNLRKFSDKILFAPHHFIEFSQFSVEKELKNRMNVVGYVGRLSPEKGVSNFLEAVRLLDKNHIEFFIIGDGILRKNIEQFIHQYTLGNRLKLIGWVPNKQLSACLNNIKILVLPSYTEGLPNIILEAMACGTLVLTTPVGSITDIIKDGETGFILKDNSPECIAENIIRVFEYPNLEKVIDNARTLIEQEFTFETAAKRYNHIFEKIAVS